MDLLYIFAAVLLRTNPDPKQPPPSYRLGEPLPENPNTTIRSILSADGSVFVFAENKANPAEPIIVELAHPVVTQLISAGGAARLREYLEMIDSPETATEVHAIDGRVWKLNETPPGETTCTIIKIVRSERGVEIVALPKEDSDLAKNGMFLVFTLMPMTFVRVASKCDPVTWKAVQEELIALDDEPDDDLDDDEEDEEEEEEVTVQPSIVGTIPPPTPAPNGAVIPPPPPAPQDQNQ
jgi:hypothetical protein